MNAGGMFKRLFQCIGLSSLVLLVNYNDLLNFGQYARFHIPYSLFGIAVSQLIAVLAFGLVLFALRLLVDRTAYREWVRLLVVFAAIWAAVLILFVLRFPKLYKTAIEVGDAVGIFAGVFAVFSIAQILVVMTWRPGPQAIRGAWETGMQPPREHPRVVWIIFDELSQDQVFDHRAHDVTLSNFDALRNESTVYTDMQPAGDKTAEVIPSLLTGRTIDDLHFRLDNKLSVQYAGQKGHQLIDGRATVFHDAQQAGWRTAVVGWYNPYCTVYGDALDSCYWSVLDRVGMDMAQDDSVWTNAKKPFSEMALQAYSPAMLDRAYCDFDVQRHLKSQIDLQQRAEELLKQDQADFIFLHLPIPHSPNVWSRVNDEYVQRCGSSYLDNLVLADKMLGRLVAVLKASRRWKGTTLIVQGDHSWRVGIWNCLPSWTDEDEQAARGKFDQRPALLIHSPGQSTPTSDGRALSLLFVHDALEAVVHGKS